jgi:hypothetical protein
MHNWKRRLLVTGLAGMSLTVLALVAYIVAAQATAYDPKGWAVTVEPGKTAEIPFPHWIPFRVVMSEPWAGSEATGFVMAGENDRVISWVGLNGNGTVTRSTAAMSTGATTLTVKNVTLKLNSKCAHTSPPTELSQPGHTLIIDTTRSNEGVRGTLIR